MMQSTLHALLDYARASGADHADGVYATSIELGVSCRMGQQEELERSESSAVGLRVWVGARQANVSTSDLSHVALRDLAQRAVDMARVATEDTYTTLAPEALLARTIPNLELADSFEPTAELLHELALRAESTARATQGITNSEGADCSYSKSMFALATSHGFYGESHDTTFSTSVSVLAGSGDAMERDYDYSVARFFEDVRDPESLGKEAAKRALARLNPRKKPTCKVPVIFDPRISSSLISSLAGAINGASVARGTTFLKDAMGTQIFAPSIHIMDDPHRVRGLGSQNFDAEGVACTKRAMIKDGVLQSWFLDCRSANKLGLTTTGHAGRGIGSNPSPSSTNLYMEAGTHTPQELMADIVDGFYITETFGMGVNLITGDYSQGASGFWIERGEIAYPVSEVTIAGHLRDMFLHLTPANDLHFLRSKNAPTLRIDGMTIAGS